MRKLILVVLAIAFVTTGAFGQDAPTLRIVTEADGLPSDLLYGNTMVKPLRLRPGTNARITIDDSDFFVQQQYVDFLGRFPDQSGFNFWNKQIADCGSDAACGEIKRINTSAAFFLSIEFQETGFYVYRLHSGSLGKRPVYAEFMPQARQVARGVIVGQDGFQNLLENNKQAFADAWIARADFKAAYDGLGNTAYVDKLITTAGLAAAAVNRDAIVAGLNAGTETRATALRKVIESGAFAQKETNPAFVQMQYFGYLRRDPDEGGYNFWLGKLNQFNGNFVNAEMVKAFIISAEYRDRF